MDVSLLAVGASASLEEGNNVARVERLASNVVRFTTVGHLSGPLARFALSHSAVLLDAIKSDFCGFYDWEKMTSYASEARSSSTSFMLAHRRQYRCAVILTGSAIVAMGVNVANVVLGGFLTATTKRAELDALQAQALKR